MRALVTGATGFVGPQLLSHLKQAVVLSRDGGAAERSLGRFGVSGYSWDPSVGPPPPEAFDGIDVVFHLAGEPVAAGRWTAEKKERIRASRVDGTRRLVQTLSRLSDRPRVLVSASAVGIYGSRGDEKLTEASPPPDGWEHNFLAETCVAWEQEAMAAEQFGIRVVTARIGIVLGNGGGALDQMLPPFRWGAGSPLGSGKQWMPWIHVEDLVRLLLFCAERENLRGAVNAVAPNPVTNREFTAVLAGVLNRWALLPPVPTFALWLMFGELAEVLLASQRVLPQAALDAGFHFDYPELEPALKQILQPDEELATR